MRLSRSRIEQASSSLELLNQAFEESPLEPKPYFHELPAYEYTAGTIAIPCCSCFPGRAPGGRDWEFGNSYEQGSDSSRRAAYAGHLLVLRDEEEGAA